MALFILYKGSAGIGLDFLPTWAILIIVVMLGVVSGVIVWLLIPVIEHYAHIKAGLSHELVVPFHIPCLESTITESEASEVELEELGDADPIPEAKSAPKEEPCPPKEDPEAGIVVSFSAEEAETVCEVASPSGVVVSFSDEAGKEAEIIITEELPVEEVDVPAGPQIYDPRTEQLFSMGQVLMAIVGSFAHGANDIANAIGPFAVVVSIYKSGTVDSGGAIPWWILVLGGVGIVLGLATWGYKVIQTIGEGLTKVTPSRGFNIELGSAVTVMTASRIGIPLSTTHCKVGAVVGVGLCDGGAAVQWKMVGNIALGWVVTLPVAGVVSAGVFLFLDGVANYSL